MPVLFTAHQPGEEQPTRVWPTLSLEKWERLIFLNCCAKKREGAAMPNRLIRDGWVESERIDMLSADAERFLIRLCLRADDFGRYHANPSLLRSNLFPLKDDVRSADITFWVAACAKAGLIVCYEVDSKPFLEILKFGQRTRALVSKFPPKLGDAGQVSGTSQALAGHPRTETETETKTDAEAHLAPATPDAGSEKPAVNLKLRPSSADAPEPRPRNSLLDALASATGSNPLQVPPSAWGGFAKALAEIRAVSADLTAEEIKRRAANYRSHMRDATLTAPALAKHWAKCEHTATAPGQNRHQQAAPTREEHAKGFFYGLDEDMNPISTPQA